LIEAAVIRIPTVIFERSTVLRSDPSEATTRLRTLLGNSWRFIGIPFRDVGIPNTSELFKLRDLRSSSALAVRREVEFMELARHPDDPRPFPTFQYPLTIRLPMLSVAAVKYIVCSNDYRINTDAPPGLKELETVGDVVFFENPLALPRFRITHD